MKWCCSTFEARVENAGHRGFGIFADTGFTPVAFVLQHRVTDPGAPTLEYDEPLASVTDTGILYCPWCGRNLRRFYRRNIATLVRDDLQSEIWKFMDSEEPGD